jgi:hypothetical protein
MPTSSHSIRKQRCSSTSPNDSEKYSTDVNETLGDDKYNNQQNFSAEEKNLCWQNDKPY